MFKLFVDWRIWALVLVLAGITVIASAAKYRIGQSGFAALKEHYPQVSDERWETVHQYFVRWGAPLVLISFLPFLTWIILPAAGAFGIRFRSFLVFAFIAKILRYWVLAFLAAGAYDLIV
jgi:membrane protein YqaA with SNARE-associated domain